MTPSPSAPERLYRVSGAARRIGVTAQTLRRYIKRGSLVAVRLPTGHYRISESALDACVRVTREPT